MRKNYLKMTVFTMSVLTVICSKTFAQTTPKLTVTANKTTIAEHESAVITASLDAPASKDVIISLDSKGTATYDLDFKTNSQIAISTIAGGNGQGKGTDQLAYPKDVSVAADGTIYVLDSGNARILKWNSGSNSPIIISLPNYGDDFFVDTTGNIYVLSSMSSIVQKQTVGTTTWTTVAGGNGNGSAANQFGYANNFFVDKTGSIYIADRDNYRIQKWASGATSGITVAGGNGNGPAANQLNYPQAVFVDTAGNVYVNDGNNNRIQKWAPNATSGTTVLGNGMSTGYVWLGNSSQGLYVDAIGNIYIMSSGNSYNEKLITKWVPGATAGIILAGSNGIGTASNQLQDSQNFSFDAKGNLYIADTGNYRVQKYVLAPQIVIPTGQTSAQITISGVEDNLENEGTEKIVLQLGAVAQATLVSPDTISIDLKDNTRTLTLQTNSPFIGLEDGAVSWGDYDKDGDQDVAVMGTGNTGASTKLYINNNGVFVDTNQNFAKLYDGDISWADLNKDGWIDLVVSGYDGTAPKTNVYISNAGKYFTQSTAFNLPQLYSTKMAWGDLDNDGDIDLAISGIDASENYVFIVMYNDNNKTFVEDTDFSKNRMGFTDGDIKIADIDLDGDNDILYSGQPKSGMPYGGTIYNSFIKSNTTIPPYDMMNLYLKNSTIEIANMNSGGLTYITSGVDNSNNIKSYSNNLYFGAFPNLKNGDIAVGDFNNDGLNDIVFTGEDSNGNPVTKLYLGTKPGTVIGPGITFIDSPIALEGLRNSTANWVDYDNDGDLDLFLTGNSSTGGIKSLLYISEIANKKNTAPAKVTGLVTEDLGNGNIKFKWDVPADDFGTNLGYEIRIGTTPGGSELSSVESNLQTGARLITKPASIYTNSYVMQLNPGKYYWSVQAVDTGLKGGAFSDESSFTTTYDWKILNQGGIVDRAINGKSSPILKLADLDNDNDMDLIYGSSSGMMGGNSILKYNGKQLVAANTNSFENANMPTSAEAGDLNGDGKVDILTTQNYGGNDNSLVIYLSNTNTSSDPKGNTNGFNQTLVGDGLYKPKTRITDINNDGKPEILILGMTTNTTAGVPKLWIYNYNGSSFTKTDASAQLESLKDAAFDLGDFDNDQDIDLIISGFNPASGLKGIIYENITTLGGDFTLKATDNNLVAIKNGTADFVDFDGDGDLDAVFTGESFNNDIFDIYLNKTNEGITTWPKLATNLTPIRGGKIDLGDFNGDGYSDLLYSGLSAGSGNITKLSEYVPAELGFKDSAFDVSDIINAQVEFGDIDGDKDLDFVIAGESKATQGSYIFRTYLNYRNDSAKVLNQTGRSASVAFKTNDKPSIPLLAATPVKKLSNVSTKTGTYPIELSWNMATDDNTPSSGLTYAIKVGTTPGGEQIMTANANSDGTRKVSGKGNVEHNTKWRLSLPVGRYYWSVQAIDASYSGSEFSSTASFEIKAGGTLSNESFEKELNISAYPNPASNFIRVSAPEELEIEKLELYNSIGQFVSEETSNTISVQNLARGVYIMKIHTSAGVTSKKIIKE